MSEFANKVRLSEIVAAKPQAVSVTTETNVRETAKLLAKKNFRSVPVWDEEEGRYVGFIDEMDLLEYAVMYAHSAFENQNVQSAHLKEKYSHFTPEEMERFSFGDGTVESILRLPGAERRRIFVFQSNAMLFNAMQIIQEHERVLVQHVVQPFSSGKAKMFMGRLMTRTHRTTQYKICSQTDVLRYIFQHIKDGREDHLQKLRVSDCGRMDQLTCITTDETAIDGFLKMLDAKAEACAVVDSQGKIVASLSASDLRGMTDEKLKTIFLPVLEFFPAMTGAKASIPLTCYADDFLVDTMRKILKASTRRCWLIDADSRPLGLLSMGKVIQCVLTNPCQHL